MSENELKEKKERAKINSAKQREEYIKLTDINEIVKIWCRRWLNSSGKTRNPGRKDISFDFLYNKCIESMKLFPYMTFKNIIEDGGRKAFYASVDRIDSSKIYSEDNIVVIPLWLNSAKLDMTIDELKEVIGSAPFKLLYEQW
jgi:hypothetical protein